MNTPAAEFAAFGAYSLEGWRSLSRHTGLPVEQVASMAVAGECASLFGTDRRLLPRAEIRSRFGGTPKPPGIDGRAAVRSR